MASTDLIRDTVGAISDQRYPGTWAQPAGFASVLNALDDPVARAQAIAGVLEPIGDAIEPLSTLDRGLLVATLPLVRRLLLQGRRDLRPDGVLVRTTPDDQRVPSRDLDNPISKPVLGDAVGLGGAETEAGTGVEGGGW
jgi:hypothetical protein